MKKLSIEIIGWVVLPLGCGFGVAASCSAASDKTENNELGDPVGPNPGTSIEVGGDASGTVNVDPTPEPPDDLDPCTGITEEAVPKKLPADIIFAIDTSGSMGEEAYYVRQHMNNFSHQIMASGIDVRVIMIAEETPPFDPCIGPNMCPAAICIAPPLGSGLCPDDSNPPHYHHIKISDPADYQWGNVGKYWDVYSNDGLLVLHDSYNDWGPLLRAQSTKTFVIVTDDDAALAPYGPAYPIGNIPPGDPDQFIADLTALDPLLQQGWKMSGIFCFTNCPPAAYPGITWEYIIDKTGGLKGDLCTQNFQPIFDDLATAIIIGSDQLSCQWVIPPPPPGEVLDPTMVNVVFTDGFGTAHTIYHVNDVSACDQALGGWFYDNNVAPTAVILCPASCDTVKPDKDGKIEIQFGCATVPLPPK